MKMYLKTSFLSTIFFFPFCEFQQQRKLFTEYELETMAHHDNWVSSDPAMRARASFSRTHSGLFHGPTLIQRQQTQYHEPFSSPSPRGHFGADNKLDKIDDTSFIRTSRLVYIIILALQFISIEQNMTACQKGLRCIKRIQSIFARSTTSHQIGII